MGFVQWTGRQVGRGRKWVAVPRTAPPLQWFFGTPAVSSVSPGTQARWERPPWPLCTASGPMFALGQPFPAPNSLALWLPLAAVSPQPPPTTVARSFPGWNVSSASDGPLLPSAAPLARILKFSVLDTKLEEQLQPEKPLTGYFQTRLTKSHGA